MYKICLLSLSQTQFVMVIIHISQLFFMKDCHYQFPSILYIIYLLEIVFLLLFLDFYYHAYIKVKKMPKVAVV